MTSTFHDICLFQNLQLVFASCLVFVMGLKSDHRKDLNSFLTILRSAYDEWVQNIKCRTYRHINIRYWPCLVKATLIDQRVISVKIQLYQVSKKENLLYIRILSTSNRIHTRGHYKMGSHVYFLLIVAMVLLL